MRKRYTDTELINGIKNQDRDVLTFIYRKYKPIVIDYITLNSGTVKEAEDVLHDSIISTYRIINKNEFRLLKSFDKYFHSVFKNTWRFYVKTKQRTTLIDSFDDMKSESSDFEICNEIYDTVQRIIFEKFCLLSKKCQDVLKMYYFERLRMKEIAVELNYKTEMIAVKKKFICLENLKALVKGNPEFRKIKRNE